MSSPTQIGPFVVERELGRGGMGVVLLAKDSRLERLVAIKTLPASFAADPSRLSRFQREAKTLAQVNHPNIASIYSLEEAEGATHLVLEYVQGESLAHRMAKGAMPTPEALRICRQIAEGLEAAHEQGIVHRDLKPGNVMITPKGLVKVLDFGLARNSAVAGASGPASEAMTMASMDSMAGQLLGTPGYMAPEQARGRTADQRADIWALGCVLYECLTGRMAFGGPSVPERLASTLADDPDFDSLPLDTAGVIRGLLQKCLQKDAEKRPRTVAEVLAELDRASGPGPEAAPRRLVDRGSVPTNLARPASSFIGRSKELHELSALCQRVRLVTLTGAAGSGKTRLAMRLANDLLVNHPDGVWFVDLAPLKSSAALGATLAGGGAGTTIGLPSAPGSPNAVAQAALLAMGAREQTGRTPMQAVVGLLGDHAPLLVLDNAEHIAEECASFCDDALRACPRVRIIVTSQQPLAISGESTFAVPPLSVPDAGVEDVASAMSSEAVALLVDRGASAAPAFELTEENVKPVVRICRRLDGIPLAIELAAARLRAFTPEQIVERLESVFSLLTSGHRTSPPRQQTLRASIEWSLGLLTAPERRLLNRLSVFSGAFTLDGAEKVCADPPGGAIEAGTVAELLASLVDKSLVMRAPGAEGRFRLLESVRQLAAEELAKAGEAARVRRRHVDYFLGLAEGASGPDRGADEFAWNERMEAEHEDLLSAAREAGASGDAKLALRFAGAIAPYMDARGHWTPARQILTEALAADRSGAVTPERAKVVLWSGSLAFDQDDYEAARHAYEQALEMYEKLGDQKSVATCLLRLGIVARWQARYDLARQFLRRSRDAAQRNRDSRNVSWALLHLGVVELELCAADRAKIYFEQARTGFQKEGDERGLVNAMGNLGLIAHDLGDLDAAEKELREAAAIAQRLKEPDATAWVMMCLASVVRDKDRLGEAADLYHQSIAIWRRLGGPWAAARSAELVGGLAAQMGDAKLAVRLFGGADGVRRTIGCPASPRERGRLGADIERVRGALEATAFAEAFDSGSRQDWQHLAHEVSSFLVASRRSGSSWSLPSATTMGAMAAATQGPRSGVLRPESLPTIDQRPARDRAP